MKTCPTCKRQFEDHLKFCPDDGSSLRFQAHAGDPMIGRLLLRRWRVLERIGSGGFGTVYRVTDTQLDSGDEALKVFNPQFMDREFAEQARMRFQREAAIMKRLSKLSSHIVGLSLFEEDPEEGLFYFFMEFVDGLTLADLVRSEGPLDLRRALRIGSQICDALLVAHEDQSQVIHRDLKLWNVMVTKDTAGDDFVKVLDFGIAKIMNERSGAVPLTVGLVPGTPGYAAPEQMLGDVDARSDLYALGVVLYGIITGREPWGGADVTERHSSDLRKLLRQQEENLAIPLRRFRPDAPETLEALVLRLLKAKPDERFTTARELKAALNAEIEALNQPREVMPPPRPPRKRKPVPWGPLAVGGSAVAILALVGWLASRPPNAGPDREAVKRLESLWDQTNRARDLAGAARIADEIVRLDPTHEWAPGARDAGLRDLAIAARDSVSSGRMEGARALVAACLALDADRRDCLEVQDLLGGAR